MKSVLPFVALIVALIVIAVLAFARPTGEFAVLGGGDGSYSYRSYSSTNASGTAGTIAKGGAGELGSVNILSATATGQVILYDGATTATSGLAVIARFPATALGGTYDLNVAVTKGVVIEVPAGFTGNITLGVR
jgi:hypothetical protein